MNKKEVLAHYTKVIDNLIDMNSYWKVFFQNPFNLDDDIRGHIEDDIPNNIDICSGATRICIIDHDYDYVVKFSYCEDRHGDVCEREENIYNAACANHLEDYFSEMVYIGDYVRVIHFYPFHNVEQATDWYGYDVEAIDDAVERLDPECQRDITICIPLYATCRAERSNWQSVTDDQKKSIRSLHSPLADRNFAVAETFVYYYGIEEYSRLSDFIVAHQINDLHCGNVGLVDGVFCLTDYGGYFDMDECSDSDDESEEYDSNSDDE